MKINQLKLVYKIQVIKATLDVHVSSNNKRNKKGLGKDFSQQMKRERRATRANEEIAGYNCHEDW